MIAAMVHIIKSAIIFKRMTSSCTSRGNAYLIDTVARLPAFDMLCTFEPMFSTVIDTVFFTNHIMVVFIRFTFCWTATTFKACFRVFAYRIVFAILICATGVYGVLGIDACVIAFNKTISFAFLRYWRLNTGAILGIKGFVLCIAIGLSFLAIARVAILATAWYDR